MNGNEVIFGFYNKKKPNEYECTNYRIPPSIFYNLSKENKKEYLKLFSGKPEQIMNYLDKINRIEKVKRDDLNKLLCTIMNCDSLDDKEDFYIICIPYIIKKKYSNIETTVLLVATKDKNDKGSKLSYINVSYRKVFQLANKIDIESYTDFINKILNGFIVNREKNFYSRWKKKADMTLLV